jgi:hypothetical protein
MKGKKYDTDKLRFDLLPVKEIEQLVDVLTYGAKKYSDNNWKKVRPFNSRYYGALQRHLSLWRQGIKIDEESGKTHLSMVFCNALFLLWGENNEDLLGDDKEVDF